MVLPLSTPKNKISFILETSSAEYPQAFITVVSPSTTVNKSEAPACAAFIASETNDIASPASIPEDTA